MTGARTGIASAPGELLRRLARTAELAQDDCTRDTQPVPNPIDVDVSRPMSVSAEAVWNVIADLDRLPEWLAFAAAVEDVSGAAQPGATYTVKPHKSYEPTTHWTVAESEPPTRQLHSSEMPVVSGVRSELQIISSGDGVTVRAHWTGAPKGVMGKLMSGMMQKRITESWERSLEALEKLASGRSAT
jgi:polyketide cyclase/dehydrase/lipid transport protein